LPILCDRQTNKLSQNVTSLVELISCVETKYQDRGSLLLTMTLTCSTVRWRW